MNARTPPVIPPPVINRRVPAGPALNLGTIPGADGLTPQELRDAVGRGARFVLFQYCVSVFVLSFKRSSPIFFIKPGESAVAKGAPYCLISFVAGWWGIPWGPIWTLATLAENLSGGKDLTPAVLSALGMPVARVTPRPSEMSPTDVADREAREARKTLIMRLAWAVIALLLLGTAWVGYKIYEAGRNMPARPGEAEFRPAGTGIGFQSRGLSGMG